MLRDLPKRHRRADRQPKCDPQAAAGAAGGAALEEAHPRSRPRSPTSGCAGRSRASRASGQVTIIGGRARQIHVAMNPVQAPQLQPERRGRRRARSRRRTCRAPGGNLETGPLELSVRIAGRVTSVEAIERIVLRQTEGGVVRVGDVAKVMDAEEDVTSIANYDGERTVVLSIRKQSGTNTRPGRGSGERAPGRGAAHPARRHPPRGGARQLRRRSAPAVACRSGSTWSLGALLAALVVLLFLGNVRSTLIAALAIPISIVGTFALMWIEGFTLEHHHAARARAGGRHRDRRRDRGAREHRALHRGEGHEAVPRRGARDARDRPRRARRRRCR